MGVEMALLARHRIFETTDLDEGSRFAGQIWERNTARIVQGKYGLRWNHAVLHRSMLSYIEHDCAVDLTVEGPLSDHFRVIFHTQGSILHAVNGQHFVSDRATALVHAPGIDLKLNIRQFEALLVSLRGEFVRHALKQRFDELPPLDGWIGKLPASSNTLALRSMSIWLCRELERSNSLLYMASKPRFHAERLLLATFIECLAEIVPKEAAVAPEISQQQARQAEEWIDGHITDVIGVEEIAEALGVGVRSLQRTFQRVRGYSPLEAVRRRRLARAREALLEARSNATVASIAVEFGFYELGRFSRKYREYFGENPSETLSRRREPMPLRGSRNCDREI
jgi:AraC-like DNA-binding protein